MQELGLEYEWKPVVPRSSETQTEEFRKINRSGKIPALQDGDFVLSESAAINTYLCDKCESALVPLAGTKERARYDQWCFWCMTELGTMHTFFRVALAGIPSSLAHSDYDTNVLRFHPAQTNEKGH